MRTARSTFLIEIDTSDAAGTAAVRGHAEHVLTGRTLDFRSWETLRAFLEDVAAPPARPATSERLQPHQETK